MPTRIVVLKMENNKKESHCILLAREKVRIQSNVCAMHP